MNMINEVFLENLSQLMKKKGLTKVALAKSLGVSQPAITNWWNRERSNIPSGPVLDKLSEVLEVEVSEFFIRDIESELKNELEKINHNDIREAANVYKKYRKLSGAGTQVKNIYVLPLGRTLPGINYHIVEALNCANIVDSDNRAFFPILFLIQALFKEQTANADFVRMIESLEPDTKKYFKRQFVKVANEVAGETNSYEELINKLAKEELSPQLYEIYLYDGGAKKFLEITAQNNYTGKLFVSDWSIRLSKRVGEFFGINLQDKARAMREDVESDKKKA